MYYVYIYNLLNTFACQQLIWMHHLTENSPARTEEYPQNKLFTNFKPFVHYDKFLFNFNLRWKSYLWLYQKGTCLFVRSHAREQWRVNIPLTNHSAVFKNLFVRDYLRTDNVHEQISANIFTPNWGYWFYNSNIDGI